MDIGCNMKIVVNGKEEVHNNNLSLGELLKIKGSKRAAVWINGKQLLKSQYNDQVLKEGDEVKILRVIAGG